MTTDTSEKGLETLIMRHMTGEDGLAVAPNILVAHPAVPVKNVRELVAYAKANPQKVNYASAAVASLGHLAGE